MNHLAVGAADPLSASRGGFDANYCRTGMLDDREANYAAAAARDGRLAALVDADEGEIIAYLLPAGDWLADAAEHYEQSREALRALRKSLELIERQCGLLDKYLPEHERENVWKFLSGIESACEEIRDVLDNELDTEG